MVRLPSECVGRADDSLETMTAKSRAGTISIIVRSLLDGLVSSEEETRNISPPGESAFDGEVIEKLT